MLKYKFQNQTIQISDNTAYYLDRNFPKEVAVEVKNFEEENKALAIKSEDSNEVYVVLPCGRKPSIRYDHGRFEWEGFELIKKVDYRDLEKKEE